VNSAAMSRDVSSDKKEEAKMLPAMAAESVPLNIE